MSNDATGWHSDDELASALERAFEVPAPVVEPARDAYEPSTQTAAQDFSDLFAALSEPTASEPTASEPTASEPTASEPTASEPTASEPTASEPTASERTLHSDSFGEKVYESLDDFLPPVPSVFSEAVDHPVALETGHTVPVTSAHVTQPIRWDRQRPSFDEIIFGVDSPEAS